MSRAKVSEVSSPISLFPFIGILLCTMGALLVVLVAVSRSARDSAQREVAAGRQNAADTASHDAANAKLDAVQHYVSTLGMVQGEGEKRLRNEQLRLRQVEDHIRRLQDKLRSVQSAANELEALERDHVDDRVQAEKEVARLGRLIADSQKALESLKEQNSKAPRSYSVVPYEGPNGTFRRPLYVECLKDELVLQPEGVRITRDDLQPPLGAGNALAAALRSGRDYIVRLHPGEGQSRDTEPYPLLLVRAEGLLMFDLARRAIEAGDFELGFELVENDWKLKYPQADPQLAGIEQTAINQARARQEVLAAAAPRAYSDAGLAAAGRFESDEDSDGADGTIARGVPRPWKTKGAGQYVVQSRKPGGANGGGGGTGYGDGGSGTSYGSGDGELDGKVDGDEPYGARSSADYGATGGGGNGGGGSGSGGFAEGDSNTSAGASGAAGAAPGHYQPGSAGGVATGASMGASGMSSGASGMPSMGNTAGNSADGSPQGPQSVSIMTGTPTQESLGRADRNAGSMSDRERANLAETRGKDWALRQKPPRAVAVRRTIHVIVREDQLAIVPDDEPLRTAAQSGTVIPLHGDTVEAMDAFVGHVREQVDSWGMAGNGLYWRPVIVLQVGPEGRRRADDLERLLKNSGLELRSDDTAKTTTPGGAHETR
jgi:hypothetical protein